MDVGGVRWWCIAASLCLTRSVLANEDAPKMPESSNQPVANEPPALTQPSSTEPPEQAIDDSTWEWTMPDDSAARHSPFFNAITGGIAVGNRFDSSFYLGAELGGFLGRFRGSLRALFPFGVSQPYGEEMTNPEFQSIRSDKPALIWGAGVGWALYSGYGFVASVTANFMRSDEGDFGNWLALALPLEWITRTGLRVGTELGLLDAFGGEVLARCGNELTFPGIPPANDTECDVGEVRAFDREPGLGIWLHFVVGVPFEHPEPTLGPPMARAQ